MNEILEQVKTFEPKQQSLEIEITIYKLILQKDFKIALTQVTELIKIEQKQRNYRRMCDMMFLRIMILKQLDDKNSLQKYTFEAQQVALNQNRPYLAKYGLFKNSK